MKLRKAFLDKKLDCVACQKINRNKGGTHLDHIGPHRENYDLFFNVNNWQALCHSCHGRKCATEDGAFGNPTKSMDWPDIGQVDFDYTDIKEGFELFNI